MKTAAVIAAAGMSSRMHAFKPLLPLGNTCLIDHVIQGFQEAGVAPVIIVTGNQSLQLKEHLSALENSRNIILVENPEYSQTEMFDSVKIGFSALMELQLSGEVSCDQVFFTPADIPLVQKDTLQKLMESNADLAKPVFQGKSGHPVLIRSSLLPVLVQYTGTKGLKGALKMTGCEMQQVETNDPGILMDADTPEEYEALLSCYQIRAERNVT